MHAFLHEAPAFRVSPHRLFWTLLWPERFATNRGQHHSASAAFFFPTFLHHQVLHSVFESNFWKASIEVKWGCLSTHSNICKNLVFFFPCQLEKPRIQSRPPLGYWKEGCRSHLATYFSNVVVLAVSRRPWWQVGLNGAKAGARLCRDSS